MAYYPTVFLALIIAWLTLTPVAPGPPGVPGLDKIGHVVAFAALAAPFAWRMPQRWWVVALAALGYGVLIELVQPLVGRSREGADLLADGTGAFLGAWIAARIAQARRDRMGN
ncbi:MAG: VanZ family protein [Pseudomonadota bacterium]